MEWGVWAAGYGISGYPMLAAFMRINCGSRSTAVTENPECIRTDHIVGRAELKLRRILIRQYCTRGSIREKALRAGMPKSSYWDLVEQGAWFVHTEYDKPEMALPDIRRYIRASVGVASAQYPQQEQLNGSG